MILTSPDGVQHECAKALKAWDSAKQRGYVELFDAADDSIVKFWWIYDQTFAAWVLTGGSWSTPEPAPEPTTQDQIDANAAAIAELAQIIAGGGS